MPGRCEQSGQRSFSCWDLVHPAVSMRSPMTVAKELIVRCSWESRANIDGQSGLSQTMVKATTDIESRLRSGPGSPLVMAYEALTPAPDPGTSEAPLRPRLRTRPRYRFVMTRGIQGPASDVAIIQKTGLGVETKPAHDPFGVWHRRRRRNRVPGEQWFYPWPTTSDHSITLVLMKAAEFFRKTSLYGKPPQVYLTASEEGLGIVPISNWMMRRGRGVQHTIWVSYSDIESVELHPATKDRMSVMTPNTAQQLGQAIIHTRAADGPS